MGVVGDLGGGESAVWCGGEAGSEADGEGADGEEGAGEVGGAEAVEGSREGAKEWGSHWGGGGAVEAEQLSWGAARERWKLE